MTLESTSGLEANPHIAELAGLIEDEVDLGSVITDCTDSSYLFALDSSIIHLYRNSKGDSTSPTHAVVYDTFGSPIAVHTRNYGSDALLGLALQFNHGTQFNQLNERPSFLQPIEISSSYDVFGLSKPMREEKQI